MKSLDNVREPSYFPAPLPHCLCHVSFRRYSPLSVVVKKRTNVKVSWPPFCSWGTTPTVLQEIVSVIYHPPFGKVWLSSVCWFPSAKPGNDVQSRIYVGWVKMAVEFEAVCGPKSMKFWDYVGNPCSCQRTWSMVYVIFRSEDRGR